MLRLLPRHLLPPRAHRAISPTASTLSRRRALLLVGFGCCRAPPLAHSYASMAPPPPPVAKKVPRQLVDHGDVRVDNYYWLRDDSRSDPDVLAHLRAENDYTAAVMSGQSIATAFGAFAYRFPLWINFSVPTRCIRVAVLSICTVARSLSPDMLTLLC